MIWKYIGLATRQFIGESQGLMCLAAFKYGADRPIVRERWIHPRDQLKETVEWCKKWNKLGYNIYMSWALYNKDERTLESMTSSAAFVADWDEGEPEKIEGLSPTIVVQTSPGRWQEVYIHAPLGREEASADYKALARRLGCDIGPSGDPVHLWRVPGTVNYPHPRKKREPSPSKWDGKVNGKVVLPTVVQQVGAQTTEWPGRRQGAKLPIWLHNALRRKYDVGQRSEQFHKVVLSLAKLGWGIDDIAEMLEGHDLGEKYGRRLGAEIERSIGKSELTVPAVISLEDGLIEFNPFDKVKEIEYLVYPYLPRGEVTLVDGDPGVGKTSLILRMVYQLLTGQECPGIKPTKIGARTLYFSVEADYERVTLPLLLGMGLKEKVGFYHHTKPFGLTEEGIEKLQELIEKLKIEVIVFDSLVSYMPDGFDMNSYKDADHVMQRLTAVARSYNCSVIAVRHNSKAAKDKAMFRGMGSIGFAAAARSQWVVREDGEVEGQYIMAHTKAQYTQEGPSLIYQFQNIGNRRAVVEIVEVDEVRGKEEVNDIKIDPDKKSKLNDACAWLKGMIEKNHHMNTAELFELGEAQSFGERLLRRAASKLDLKRTVDRTGKGTESVWSL